MHSIAPKHFDTLMFSIPEIKHKNSTSRKVYVSYWYQRTGNVFETKQYLKLLIDLHESDQWDEEEYSVKLEKTDFIIQFVRFCRGISNLPHYEQFRFLYWFAFHQGWNVRDDLPVAYKVTLHGDRRDVNTQGQGFCCVAKVISEIWIS